MKITVVVPSRGLTALLRVCLSHLVVALENADADHKIVVVDNASSVPYRADDFDNMDIEIIRFDKHHSYAAACNLGAASVRSEWLLTLNNDVLLHPLSIKHMLVAGEGRNVGICGSRLVFPDDSIQHCGVVFGPGERGPYHDHRKRPTSIVSREFRRLQAVTGACMLIRRDCFEQVAGFDEQYLFGLEDIDFCLRARQFGWKVVCDQTCDSLHFESMTEGRIELDVPSRKQFMRTWRGRYSLDGWDESEQIN